VHFAFEFAVYFISYNGEILELVHTRDWLSFVWSSCVWLLYLFTISYCLSTQLWIYM